MSDIRLLALENRKTEMRDVIICYLPSQNRGLDLWIMHKDPISAWQIHYLDVYVWFSRTKFVRILKIRFLLH